METNEVEGSNVRGWEYERATVEMRPCYKNTLYKAPLSG